MVTTPSAARSRTTTRLGIVVPAVQLRSEVNGTGFASLGYTRRKLDPVVSVTVTFITAPDDPAEHRPAPVTGRTNDWPCPSAPACAASFCESRVSTIRVGAMALNCPRIALGSVPSVYQPLTSTTTSTDPAWL